MNCGAGGTGEGVSPAQPHPDLRLPSRTPSLSLQTRKRRLGEGRGHVRAISPSAWGKQLTGLSPGYGGQGAPWKGTGLSPAQSRTSRESLRRLRPWDRQFCSKTHSGRPLPAEVAPWPWGPSPPHAETSAYLSGHVTLSQLLNYTQRFHPVPLLRRVLPLSNPMPRPPPSRSLS